MGNADPTEFEGGLPGGPTGESRGLGREVLVYAASSIANALIGFIAIYKFSRLLDPAEFGVYYLVYAAVTMINMFACAWINQTLKRYYPMVDPAELPGFMGRIAAAYIWTAGLLFVLTAVASLALPLFGWSAMLPWLALFVAAPMALNTFVQWLFRIHRRPFDWMITQLTLSGGRLLLGWLLLTQLWPTGRLLLVALGLSALAAATWGLIRLREPCALSRSSFSWASLRSIFSYGLPLSLVSGGSWMISSTGRLVLGLLTGQAAVGIYSTAQQLAAQLTQLAVTPLHSAADPLAIRVFEREGRHAASRYLTNLLGLVLLLGGGVGLTLYLLREPVVGALLAPAYAAGAGLIGYLAPAVVFLACMPVLTKSYALSQRTGGLSWLMLGAGALNVSLNFLLIPFLAEAGAALSLVLSYGSLCVATYLGGLRLLAWRLPWRMLVLMVPALGTLIVLNRVLPVPSGLWATAAFALLYLAAYLACCTALFVLGRSAMREELRFLGLIFARRDNPVA